MFRTIAILATAIGVISLSAPASADPISKATDFSSQNNRKGGARQGGGGGGGGRQGGPVVRSNAGAGGGGTRNVNRNVNRNTTVNVNRKATNVNRNATTRVNRNVNVNRNVTIQRNVNVNRNVNRRVGAVSTRALVAGPGRVNRTFVRPANFSGVRVANRVWPAWRSGHRIWWGGGWRTFLPLTALGVVVVGGAYYWPDAYLGVARPYCEGISPEGCRLNWQQVGFEGGGEDWQCVQFCPRPGSPPPARTVALVAPPPPPQGGACEVSIYSEPNFAGTNATAADEQPNLGETGWQDQIASVQVKAGTWDFFAEPQFTGEVMRLAPGSYADLGPQWTKHSGSFMCVQQ